LPNEEKPKLGPQGGVPFVKGRLKTPSSQWGDETWRPELPRRSPKPIMQTEKRTNPLDGPVTGKDGLLSWPA